MMSLKILALRSATKALNGLAGWLRAHPNVIVRSTELVLGAWVAFLIYVAIRFVKFCVAG
jgi:hypothetical protein